jgi:hypothetical protein
MPQLPDSFDGMLTSKYLKKEDFPDPRVMTIERFTSDNVAREDEPPETKWILHFVGEEKPMVLNSTNIQILKMAYGSPGGSIGKQVQVYTDPNVSFGGKLVGGLRLRGPSKKPPSDQPKPPAVDGFDDDIPF